MMSTILLAPEKVSFPGLGIEGLQVDRVAFSVGSVNIYWYGIILASALFICVLLAILQAKKNHFSADLTIDIALVCFPAAIVGARLYYVLSEWKQYDGDLLRIINIRDGGLGVIGGVLAAILAGYILARVRKIPAHIVFDYCIVYIPLGQAIGRWGNFFNQEAFGTNTSLPWGMTSESVSWYLSAFCPTQDPNIPVHPTFLYESLAMFVVFAILLIIRNRSKFAFTTTAGYLVLHGVVRFLIEGLRTDSLYIGETGLRLSQVTSVMMVVVGITLVVISRLRGWERETQPVENFFSGQGRFAADEQVNERTMTEVSENIEPDAEDANKAEAEDMNKAEAEVDTVVQAEADTEKESETLEEAPINTDLSPESQAETESGVENDADSTETDPVG
jgi:phosphatidylglycerol:prolipoprotein diacylglycerol transferase